MKLQCSICKRFWGISKLKILTGDYICPNCTENIKKRKGVKANDRSA